MIETKELKREVYHPRYGFALWETTGEYDFTHTAQLLAQIGLFESVSQARKSGITGKIIPGEFWLKRRNIHLFIETE